ncbi:unnamed protein product [Natator depressus]
MKIAKVLFKEIICRYGSPEVIDLDRGPQFVLAVWKALLDALGIQRKLHIPRHPHSSGQVERMNRTIKAALSKVLSEKVVGRGWTKHLPLVLAVIRSRSRYSSSVTPFQLMFGQPMHLMRSQSVPSPSDPTSPELIQWCKLLREELPQAVQLMQQTMGQAQEKMDKGRQKPPAWQVGDQVVYMKWNTKPLQARWEGPFTICNKGSDTVFQID